MRINIFIGKFLFIILLIYCFVASSCSTMYEFNRAISTSPVKDDFAFPEKKELGEFANLTDANIRINLLIATGVSFIIKSQTLIYKDNKPIEQNNTEQGYFYEITYKDIGSTFLSFSYIFLQEKQVCKVLKVEKKDDTQFYLIANIPFIYYLSGVLSAEMGKSFPQEALKAQSVAARTYFYATTFTNNNSKTSNNSASNNAGNNANNSYNNFKPYDIENSVNYQVFSFNNIEYFIPFIAATDNLVLKYQGSIFPTYFHSHSGGMLTTPQLVWGKESKPIYKVKEDIYSGDTYKWKVEIGRFFLKTLFQRAGYDVDGHCSNIEILGIGEDKRISLLRLSFSNGKTVEIKGDAFRKLVGTTVIKSTNFTFTYDNSTQNYIFNGIGYGHGIGLSQFGAKAMAEQGFTFDKILLFYYNDVEISKMIN